MNFRSIGARALLGITAALVLAGAALAQGSTVNNAVGVWGQDTGTGKPCLVAPAPNGSSTCQLPGSGGGGGGGGNSAINTILLTNGTSSGTQTLTNGGGYYLNLPSTFNGATITVVSTSPSGVVTSTPYTVAPGTAPCFQTGSGTTISATAAGGTPTGNTTFSGTLTCPGSMNIPSTTPVESASYETSHVVCAAACNLADWSVTPDATGGAANYNVLLLNATTDPGNGTVAPIKCYPGGVGGVGASYSRGGLTFSTGLVLVVSTAASCFTETQSAHFFISGDY